MATPLIRSGPCYDWSTRGSVTLTIIESDGSSPGGYMALTATPRADGGSPVHGQWEQTSKNLTALIRGNRDAIHWSTVPAVVLQEGLRRFVILELGGLLGGHLADDLVDRPPERLNTETDRQRPQLTGLVGDRVPLPGR
jgi:hypothetical protein